MVHSAFIEHLLYAQAYSVLGPTVCQHLLCAGSRACGGASPLPRPTQQTLVLCLVQAQEEILSTSGDERPLHVHWNGQTKPQH